MKDNNPFKPVLPKPVDDSILSNDPAADNFLAGNDNLGKHTKRPAVAIDGISDFNDFSSASNQAPHLDSFESYNGSNDNSDGINDIESANDFNQTNNTPDDAVSPFDSEPDSNQSQGQIQSNQDQPVAPPASKSDNIFDTLSQAADNKSSKANAKKASKTKTNQFTISILTIVFFVLFLASAGVAAYFGIQNNKNANDLADSKAQVQKLSDENNNSTNSTNKNSTNYDALQDKIADLTKQNEDKQKTLDDNKKTIDDQTKKISDLNGQMSTLQKKVDSDSKVSENVGSLITTLCTKDDFKSSSACVSGQSNQQSTQPNTNQNSQ